VTPVAAFAVAFLLSVCLCFPLRWGLLRWKMIDLPSSRSSHSRATPTAGGVAIVLTVGVVGLWGSWTSQEHLIWRLQVAVIVGMVVSFADDRRSVRVPIRLGCHVFMAWWGLMILQLARQSTMHGMWSLTDTWSGLLIMLWLAGYTNAFNFMDGINGLAATQGIVTSLGAALIAVSAGARWIDAPVLYCFFVAGASAGFLPHNFPRARMFMGDSGSVPLGFVLAFGCIWMSVEYGPELFVPLALLQTNFVLDAFLTVMRRLYKGDRWWEGHREHFYQHLVRSGQSHTVVTLAETGLQVVVLGLMIGYFSASPLLRTGLIISVLGLWLGFFGWCELSFRRALAKSPLWPSVTDAL
jgi:UDP-N-acetylmuramyl pentapeptide phosphotransferase/UDP-N-acetylglucosamine-1-phosphate transferase